MAYNKFTFDLLESRFGVRLEERRGLFESIPPAVPSDLLTLTLERNLPLVEGLGTEKARSEFLIAPILSEVRQLAGGQIGLFSGVEFTVDRAAGLLGFCDFLLSRSPHLLSVRAPVVAIVEAKREDLTGGMAQCLAEMIAAQRFNEARGEPIETIYGTVTSGTLWRFLRIRGSVAEADLQDYYIEDIEKILGILVSMVQ